MPRMTTNYTTKSFRLLRLAAAASVLLFAFAMGCGDNTRDDEEKTSSDNSAAIVGTWRLVSDTGSTWYAHFSKDGTWKITDDAEGNARRVYGTYICKGFSFSGPMINPRVGTGRIEGTFEDNSMTMDFIEYWHTPAKHVLYTGSKL